MKTKNKFGGEDLKLKNDELARWVKEDGIRIVYRFGKNLLLKWAVEIDDCAPESIFTSVWKGASK